MNQYVQSQQGELNNLIEFFKKDLGTLRVGRATPAMLEHVQVVAYGATSSINGLASISVSDAKSMTVTPWDKGVLKDIEKAIIEADLGIGIVNEGDKIRITIPSMTEENRKALVKKVGEKAELTRINVRKVRDDIKTAIEQAMKDKEIGEDDKFKFIKELEDEIKKTNDLIKELCDKKEQEIMTI